MDCYYEVHTLQRIAIYRRDGRVGREERKLDGWCERQREQERIRKEARERTRLDREIRVYCRQGRNTFLKVKYRKPIWAH